MLSKFATQVGLIVAAVLLTSEAAWPQARIRIGPRPGGTPISPPIVIRPNSLNPGQLDVLRPALPDVPRVEPSIPETRAAPAPQRMEAARVIVYEDQRGNLRVLLIPPPPPARPSPESGGDGSYEAQCERLCGDDYNCLQACKSGR